MPTFPEGKHKGRDVRTVPASYLAWARLYATGPVQHLADEEWDRRFTKVEEWLLDYPEDLRDEALQIMETGYKQLVLKLHPDQGGDNEKMVQLTRAMTELRRFFGK